MEAENASIGGETITFAPSLPVESVQEIVRRDPNIIPERYLRNSESSHADAVLSHLSHEIPVIDLSMLSNGDKKELERLDVACRDWGFFQIINHGIEAEVLRKVKAVATKFFELPLEEKMKYSMASDDIQGYGHAYVVSEEQKLDWADLLVMLVYPTTYRKSRFWPKIPREFTETVEIYSMEVNRVAQEILTSLSLLMEMKKDELLKLHKEIMQAMRVNYYPTCCKPDQVVGLTPHSDTSSVTILLQDSEVTGLQIKHFGGWVPVKPVPDALVLNIGDVIEVLSNGRFKSIEHRAITNDNKARISIASFICPQDDVEIEPLELCKGNPRYKKMRYGDYLRSSMRRKMDGKTSNMQLIKFEMM